VCLLHADALQTILFFTSDNPLTIWALRLVASMWLSVVPSVLSKMRNVTFDIGMVREIKLVASVCPNLRRMELSEGVSSCDPWKFCSYSDGLTLVSKPAFILFCFSPVH